MKSTFLLLIATFLTFSANAQLSIARDSAYCKTNCTDLLSEDTITFKNIGATKDTFRWRTNIKRLPTNWNWTICDPKECTATGTTNNWFLLGSNATGNIKLDYAFPKSNDSALVYIYLFKSMDSLNTLKILKFSSKAVCASAGVKSTQTQNYTFHHNILSVPSTSNIDQVKLFNMNGVLVNQFKLSNNIDNQINFNAFESGIYILTFNDNNQHQSIKFVVE